MSREATALGLSTEAQALHFELLTACEQHRPPCRGCTEWTSDSAEDRSAAAEGCTHCLHVAKCHAFARSARESHGVWGARDRTTSPSTARRRAADEHREDTP